MSALQIPLFTLDDDLDGDQVWPTVIVWSGASARHFAISPVRSIAVPCIVLLIFSRPYWSNGQAIGIVVVRLAVCPSVCNGCIVAKC